MATQDPGSTTIKPLTPDTWSLCAAGDAGRRECRWQRDQLPDAVRELVLDDQRMRNDICWSVSES